MKLTKDLSMKLDEVMFKLMQDSSSKEAIKELKDILKDITSYDFDITVVPTSQVYGDNKYIWAMSVFPETSTIDKIIKNIGNTSIETIKDIWKKTKVWTLELDARIFDSHIGFSEKELSAMVLHEIGHVISSNDITSRIYNILVFEFSNTMSASSHKSINTGIFRRLLSLPILNMCVSSQSKSASIKNEINADKFVCSSGYRQHLVSAFDKIINFSSGSYGSRNIDNNLKDTFNFSKDTIEQFKKRKDKIVKHNLLTLRECCESPFISEAVNDIYNFIYMNEDTHEEDCRKTEFIRNQLLKNDEEYVNEAFGFLKDALKRNRPLPRLDPTTLDYIDIKTAGIKSLDDKMMLVVYIQSKLDLINTYINMYLKKDSKANRIPYSMEELESLKTRLEEQKKRVVATDIHKGKGMLIAWPEGYEG